MILTENLSWIGYCADSFSKPFLVADIPFSEGFDYGSFSGGDKSRFNGTKGLSIVILLPAFLRLYCHEQGINERFQATHFLLSFLGSPALERFAFGRNLSVIFRPALGGFLPALSAEGYGVRILCHA